MNTDNDFSERQNTTFNDYAGRRNSAEYPTRISGSCVTVEELESFVKLQQIPDSYEHLDLKEGMPSKMGSAEYLCR